MRERAFFSKLHEMFNLKDNLDVARNLAVALGMAMKDGSVLFAHDGTVYKITQEWYDGCIRGIPCNPATCYTKWAIDKATLDDIG